MFTNCIGILISAANNVTPEFTIFLAHDYSKVVSIPHLHLPVQHTHKEAIVLHNEMFYFGLLINRVSVPVRISAPFRYLWEVFMKLQGQWVTWLEDISFWITCMEECKNMTRPEPMWFGCGLWIVNTLVTVKLIRGRDPEIHHKTVLQRTGFFRWQRVSFHSLGSTHEALACSLTSYKEWTTSSISSEHFYSHSLNQTEASCDYIQGKQDFNCTHCLLISLSMFVKDSSALVLKSPKK